MVKSVSQTETICGLLVDRKPIPLEGVSVEATLRDFCTRVTLTQRYRNREDKPVEAVYVFPIDETAAVCGFEALIDDVHVAGKVMEREKAFEAYDDAIADGHGAYLLDQERPDVFTASIGNIPPGKEVLVKITYVTELGLEGDDLRFVLPTTVSPRYAPAEDRAGVGRSPAEAVNPPVDWKVPYGLELEIQLEMPSVIRSVESPSHPISVEVNGKEGRVGLGERESALDRDFVLLIRLSECREPRAWIEKGDGQSVSMVAFQPQFDGEEAPSELIFVIDRSGSMGGESIAEARNALQLCLRSLTEGSRFNIVGFGSTYEMLFPESRPYDEETLGEASRHVEEIRSDLGGTEILLPLQNILRKPSVQDLPRQLFILTDGQVSNTEAVVELIRKHSDSTRVFTFGIGAGASHHLVRGMARAGEGAAEFIYPGERIEKKVMRQLAKALKPAVTEVQIDWGDLRVTQAPHRVPPVFAGGRLLVYGFVGEPPKGVVEVELKVRSPKGELSFRTPLDFECQSKDNLIATLGARTRIRDLEEGSSLFHDRKGSLQKRSSRDRVKQEAVRLGVEYGLCSRWTSFVAVENRETPVQGEMQLRRIPVALTRGWGGLEEMRFADLARPMARASAVYASAPSPSIVGKLADRLFGGSAETVRGLAKGSSHPPYLEETSPILSKERPLDRLVALQRADGSWDLNETFAEVLGRSLDALEGKLTGAEGEPALVRRAWATALALIWLKVEANRYVDEWVLLEKKARKWLGDCPARLEDGQEWLEAAAEFFPDGSTR